MDASYDKLDLPFELALACRDDDRLAQRHPRRLRRGAEGAVGRVRPAARASTRRSRSSGSPTSTRRCGSRPSSPLAVGDAILLIPAHVDPTVNLHAALHAVEADGTVHRWPVDARRP